MSYQCEKCQETTTIGEVVSAVIKIATLGAVVYFGIKFKDDIEKAVGMAIQKGQKHLGRAPKRRKRGK